MAMGARTRNRERPQWRGAAIGRCDHRSSGTSAALTLYGQMSLGPDPGGVWQNVFAAGMSREGCR